MRANLDGLDAGQRELWPELAQLPQTFVLYGGVALTLRFNHRRSSDFDFFASERFDPQKLYSSLPFLADAEVRQSSPGTLTCLVARTTPVKISFFGVPELGRVGEPEIEDETGLQLASLLDIAATKASVVQKRALARDYIDLDILLTRGQLSLDSILSAARQIYGRAFNPQITLKALSYFGDGDLPKLAPELQARLREAVRATRL